MPEYIFIAVAWPYANGVLHLGQIAGCYLPADIFARYHRFKGNNVLMVSGSDQHGTPITLSAEQQNLTPQQVVDKYHQSFLDSWESLGITFDLFTTTGTDNHRQTTHDIFLTLHEKGYIYADMMTLPYCNSDGRFLPDRYVEGVCPFCDFTSARGDQCDNCGKPMNPIELRELRCRLCGDTPEFRDSEHLFLKLSALCDQLIEWVQPQTHWRPNVRNFTLRYLEEGLHDRAISRDIDWGIPIPLPGYEDKRIYVWFEAVIGYLSAAKEWAQHQNDPDSWKAFWVGGQARPYYFIGKDNIPFHTIIWPAMLMGYEGLNLPYDVPANEFLTMAASKISTSRQWAVWLPDYLDRFDPDPLRYFLSAAMPETSDSDFSWKEFQRRNNDELVATYGNVVHRVLTFAYRNFDAKVPQPSKLTSEDQHLLDQAKETIEAVDTNLGGCHFREGIRLIMALAQDTNRYLESTAPWKTLREDRSRCATSLWTAMNVLATLRLLAYPYLPFSSQKLHEFLGYEGNVADVGWNFADLTPGQELQSPEALFVKLEDEIIEQEVQRLQA
jgi:methionyl-tRNA synthetase